MYTYKEAAESVKALNDSVVLGGVTPEDAIDLAGSLADTIGWWESDDKMKFKQRLIVADLMREKDDELCDLRLSGQIYEQEIGDLKEERDQLVDENIALMESNDRANGIIGAVEQIVSTNR